MRIRLIAVGTRMPGWVETAFTDYVARLPREYRFELVEIAPAQRGKSIDVERARQQEGEKLLRAIAPGERVIAFDERGRGHGSVQWSTALQSWLQSGRDTSLLIGGADGFVDAVRQRADECWSLSPLTLPHALVRVLVAEQLFRAWSLLAGHPYHRA